MKGKKNKPTSVGICIRKARAGAAMSMKELAEAVGVNAAYMGMIERGERNPSESLLEKIAKATKSSPELLKESLSDAAAPSANSKESGSFVPAPTDIDVDFRYFLALAVQEVPAMKNDKCKLADMLGVSAEILDDIISGREYEAAPHWADCFASLAKQMDIPSVCRKIRSLDQFLQRENAEKKQRCLYASLKRVAGAGYQLYTPAAVPAMDGDGFGSGAETCFNHVILRKGKATADDCDWRFVFCRFSSIIDRFAVKDIMDAQLDSVRNTCSKTTLVFESEEILRLFEDDYSRRQTEKDALAEISTDAEPLPPISLLLVDPNTWEGVGELVELDDVDGFDDCP